MNSILSSFTKVEHFDSEIEETFLLLTSQLNLLADRLVCHALERASQKELVIQAVENPLLAEL